MITFPDFITVPPFVFKVEVVPKDDIHGNLGLCDYDNHTIFVADHLGVQQALSTLMHEITHAIFEISGTSRLLPQLRNLKEEDYEEMLVSSLEQGFTGFILANPDLYDFISHILKSDGNFFTNVKDYLADQDNR